MYFFFLPFFRDLRCLRNTIHANLFVTYIMSSFLWILALSLHVRCIFITEETKNNLFSSSFLSFLSIKKNKNKIKLQMVTHVGPVVCIFIAILLQYFTLTNFCWMLVEGKFLERIPSSILCLCFLCRSFLIKCIFFSHFPVTSCGLFF